MLKKYLIVFILLNTLIHSYANPPWWIGSYPTETLQTFTNEKFKVSVISKATLNKIFQELSHADLPFGYAKDGCFARAHAMVRILEKKNIIAGKIFAEGSFNITTPNSLDGKVTWGSHVAPLILVEINSKKIPYVIDPALFHQAITQEEWLSRLTKEDNSYLNNFFYSSRFCYNNCQFTKLSENYDETELRFMVNELRVCEIALYDQEEVKCFRLNGN